MPVEEASEVVQVDSAEAQAVASVAAEVSVEALAVAALVAVARREVGSFRIENRT